MARVKLNVDNVSISKITSLAATEQNWHVNCRLV